MMQIKGNIIKTSLIPIFVTLITLHILTMRSIEHYHYNLSALIRLTENQLELVVPDYFQKGMVIFEKDGGYDGQFYYYSAMDPFLNEKIFKSSFRRQRVLYPLFANWLALGKKQFLPVTLYLTNLLAIALGMGFFILILLRLNLHPFWSLLYGLCPATIMTVQYDLPSPVSIALMIIATYFYLNEKLLRTVIALSLALLTREDSVMLLLPLLVWDFFSKKKPERIALLLASLVPFFLWQVFLSIKLGGQVGVAGSASVLSLVPLAGLVNYFRDADKIGVVSLLKIFSTLLLSVYMFGVTVTIGKRLFKTQHLFYYVTAAYGLLFLVEAHWDDYNGFFRIFYGLFPFLIFAYSVEKNKWVRNLALFIAVLTVMTVIRNVFISPVFPFRIV